MTTIMQEFKAGVLYFALVFGAGFVLGTVRTLWIVPRVGARRAELMETPIMLVVTIVGRTIVHAMSTPMKNGAIFAGLGRSHGVTAETSRERPRCRGRGKKLYSSF